MCDRDAFSRLFKRALYDEKYQGDVRGCMTACAWQKGREEESDGVECYVITA